MKKIVFAALLSALLISMLTMSFDIQLTKTESYREKLMSNPLSVVPIINGRISVDEWTDAAKYHLKFGGDHYPDYYEAYIYLKNNEEALYICVDSILAKEWVENENFTDLRIYFDADHDGSFSNGDCYFYLGYAARRSDYCSWIGHYVEDHWVESQDDRPDLMMCSYTSSSDRPEPHWIMEFKVPFNSEEGIPRKDVIGFLLTKDNEVINWPYNSFAWMPETFGDLSLASIQPKLEILEIKTNVSQIFIGDRFYIEMLIKNTGNTPIYLWPFVESSFNPEDSIKDVEGRLVWIFIDCITLDPGQSMYEIDPFMMPNGWAYEACKDGAVSYTVTVKWGFELDKEGFPIIDQETSKTWTFTIYSLQTYVLHVQSQPIDGVWISYSGDYSGADDTSFDVGPKDAPFTVTLTAPLVHEDYKFSYWLLDGANMGQSNSITVKVDDEKRERTAVAVYSKEVIKYTLHVKSEPVSRVSISYSGDYSGTGTTNFDIGPKDSRFRVVLTAPSTFQNYKFAYWYIPELKLITLENPFICYHLKTYTSLNELTAIAVFSKDTSVIDLKTVPIEYTGVITLAERGFEEYAGTQELKFNVDQKLTNLIAWFHISRYDWRPEGPLSTPKEYPNINFNIRISSPQGTEYSVTMNTSRGFTDIWIPIPEPVQGSWTVKIIGFTEDDVSTKCKYRLDIREDKSSIVKPLTVINLNTGKAEEKFGCSLWVQAYSKNEKVSPLMPSYKEPLVYVITITFHSDLKLEENFPNMLAVGYDDVLGKRDDKWTSLYIDNGGYEGFEQPKLSDPWIQFAIKWSFEGILHLIPGASEAMGIIELLKEFWNLNVQDWYKPVVEEAFDLYRGKFNDNELDIICFNVPTSLEEWEPKQTVKRLESFCNLSLAPTAIFKIYAGFALTNSLNYYYVKPQVFEYKISGTILSLKEEKHKLYLGIYDSKGNYVGFDPSEGRIKEEIEGARYIDFMNGTTIIVIPPEYKDLQVIVDASNAEEQQECYNLTITHITQNGSQIAYNFQGVIRKNGLQKLKVDISDSSINIEEIKEVIPWIKCQPLIAGVVGTVAILTVSIVFMMRRRKRYEAQHITE